MNTDLTEIAFVLDRSGSMGSIAEQAIQGFNEFLAEQRNSPGQARLTLLLFDDQFLFPADYLPLEEVVPLDRSTYVPRNSTALLDAIGLMVDRIGERLGRTPEEDRPGKVIVAILTDGLENASTQFTWRDVSEKIRHQTETYSWEFLFLGANQDAIATAGQLSIAARNAGTWSSDAAGTLATGSALARKAKAVRAASSGASLSARHWEDLEKPMSEILKEEDDEKRK